MHDDAAVDLKESFNFGLELGSDTLANVADNPLIGPNVWPADMPWFKDGVYPFFESSTRCAEAVLSGFAMAAGLAPDCFTRHADLPISRGSLQFYPPQPSELGADRFGVSAHTDFGVLTVLCQDDIGGLELESLDGEWIAVPPIPSTMVVNVGDLLARWSNGRYRSTPHRVIITSGRERLSVVLAYDPNFETLADPSLFCDAGEATIAPPITCGEYLMRRFEKAFAYRR